MEKTIRYFKDGLRGVGEAMITISLEEGEELEPKLKKIIGWQVVENGNYEVVGEKPRKKVKKIVDITEEKKVKKEVIVDLEEDKKEHIIGQPDVVICDECGKEAKSEFGLKIHQSRKH